MNSIKKIIIFLFLIFIAQSTSTYDYLSNQINIHSNIHRYYDKVAYHKAKNLFISQLDTLLREAVPNTSLCAERIVEECEKYKVDPLFVCSQSFIEGHLGTRGLSKTMNSAFNVGAYDGKGTSYMTYYKDVNDSIEPYLKLLTTKYLVDKTEKDLMENYVDCNGKRYASNSDYEKSLVCTYNKFYNKTLDSFVNYIQYYEKL